MAAKGRKAAADDEPLRRDARENRARLLAAAEAVFAEHGLDAPVEEIARSAGVGLGTLYRRFPTKDALIEQLVHDLYEDVLELGRQALELTDGSGLETFIWGMGEIIASRRGCLNRLWNSSASGSAVRDVDRVIGTLLERAKTAGTVRHDCARTDVSLTLWGLRGVIETASEVAPDAWRRQLDIALAGIRPGAAELSHAPVSDGQRKAISRLAPARALYRT